MHHPLGPPHSDSIRLTPGGQLQLQISGPPGDYAVEAASNQVDWAHLTNFTTTGAAFQCLDQKTNLTQRFYRMRLW